MANSEYSIFRPNSEIRLQPSRRTSEVDFSELIKEAEEVDQVGRKTIQEQAVVDAFRKYDAAKQEQAIKLLTAEKAKVAQQIATLSGENFKELDNLTKKLEKIESLQAELQAVVNNVERATASWAKKEV